MLKIASRVLSILAHPILMPIYCAFYTLYLTEMGVYLPAEYRSHVLMAIGCSCSLTPLGALMFFVASGRLSDMEMAERSERSLPLAVAGIASTLSIFIVVRGHTPFPLTGMAFAMSTLTLLAALISLRWKISLHAMGVGGLLSFVVTFGLLSRTSFTTPAVIALALSGLATWARLYVEAHTPWQLVGGYLLGMTVTPLLMIFI